MSIIRMSLELPASPEQIANLRAGQLLSLRGYVYTARDAAHKKLAAAIEAGKSIPFDLNGQSIYYTGPCPPGPGQIIGSAGPTTSGRMDAYTPLLLKHGLRVMIGKGERSPAVIEAMRSFSAVYLGATGGAGALLAQSIKKVELIAYPELGAESVRLLYLQDFPAIVLIDSTGNNLYESGRNKYRQSRAESQR